MRIIFQAILNVAGLLSTYSFVNLQEIGLKNIISALFNLAGGRNTTSNSSKSYRGRSLGQTDSGNITKDNRMTVWNSSSGVKYCRELPDNDNKMWLLGEVGIAGGLCNQLFGVFGFAPVAILFNASLITGPMISRDSFSKQYGQISWSKIPFSEFFNFEHFSSYWWREHRLQVVEMSDYDNCLGKYNMKEIIRTKKFFPQSNDELLNLFKTQNITVPENTSASERIFHLNAEHKFIALYKLRSGRSKQLFYDVINSLRPSARIQSRIDVLRQHLPQNYISAHMRLERDVVFDDKKFHVHLNRSIEYLAGHKCLAGYRRHENGSFINLPTVYISSGIFDDAKDHHRVGLMRRALHDLGIMDTTSRHHLTNQLSLKSQLFPEQEALVDFTISKESSCFVPAGMMGAQASSFSYLVKMLQLLSQGWNLYSSQFGEELGSHNSFEGWWRRV